VYSSDLITKILLFFMQVTIKITSNNGYLGSRIDEDRSEFRYLMRIAELVNHQTVERTLHFFTREVSLFECVLTLLVFNKRIVRLFLVYYCKLVP
jgi:hypothetical protein